MNASVDSPTSNHIQRSRRIRFDGLQALRAVAASLVIIDHSIMNLAERGLRGILEHIHQMPTGNSGVMVFFVISGFIMVYTAYSKVGPTIKPIPFAWRRIRRILPIYWVATVAYALLLRAKTGAWPPIIDFVRSLFFVPLEGQVGSIVDSNTSMSRLVFPILGQGWTLYLEMVFYALFFLCLFVRGNRGIYIGVGVLSLLSIIHVAAILLAGGGSLPAGILFYTMPILLLFASGMLFGLWFVQGKIPTFSVPWPTAVSAAIIVGGVLTGRPIVCGVLSVAAVFIVISNHAEGRGLLFRLVELAGNASYSTYLFHNFVIGVFGRLWIKIPLSLPPVLFVVFCLCTATAFGIVMHLAVERPLTAYLSGQSYFSRSWKRALPST